MQLAGNATRKLGRDIDSLEAKSGRFGKVGTLALKGIAAAAIVASVAVGHGVREWIAYEKGLRNVNSISNLTERQLGQLSNQIISLSKTVPQSAQELVEAQYDVASSGFQGAEGLKITAAAGKAATAGISTTATAARAITGVINAYGLEADDARAVSDTLFQTVNLGVLSFDDLAQNIGDVVSMASAAKVSLSDIGSAIATMTKAGIVPAEAFTSLNRVLQQIIQPSEALKSLFAKLGYESGAAALESKGLEAVMQDIGAATGGNATALLQLFPEIRAAKGAFSLLSNEGKLYAENTRLMNAATSGAGATHRAFKEQMKATGNQLTLLKNEANAFLITAGAKMAPAVLGIAKALASSARWLNEHRGVLLAVAAVMVTMLIPAILKLGTAFMAALGPALLGATGRLAIGLGALFSPMGLLTAGVVALGVGWINATSQAKTYVSTVKGQIGDVSDIEGRIRAVKRLTDEHQKAQRKTMQRGPKAGTIFDFMNRKARERELGKAEREERAALNRSNARIIKIRSATGMTRQEVEALARTMAVDLGAAEERGKTPIGDMLKAVQDLEQKTGMSIGEMREQIGGVPEEWEAAAAEMEETIKGVKDSFTGFFDIFGADFTTATAEQLDDLKSKVTSAERDLEVARRKEGASSFEAAEAERELAAARRELTEANKSQEEQAREFYEKRIAQAKAFLEDIRLAQEAGVDPEFIKRALLQGPETAGPLLDAVVSDHSGRMIQLVNESEAAMRAITQAAADALKPPPAPPADPSRYGLTDRTILRPTGFRQHGAVDAHVARQPTILYGERATGGEAFIPLGSQNRKRSLGLTRQVARMFGHELVPMQDGGFMPAGRAMVGSSASPTIVHVNTTVPQSQSTSYQFGDIHGLTMEQVQREANRRARLAALAGGI